MTGSPSYSRPLILLHWLVFLAAALAVAAIEIKGFFPKGTPERAQLGMLHESLGIIVLALMTLRLMVRALGRIPLPASSYWVEMSVHAMHAALYVLMLAMPILGLMALGWSGKPVPLFGTSWTLPMAIDMPLGRNLKQIHEFGANLVFIAVGLHAAAALWHQFVLKDGLMQRMRPGR